MSNQEREIQMLDPIKVIVRGKHDTGKTTLASLIKMFLDENGYRHVTVRDVPPLDQDKKGPFWDRFARNRDARPVDITVELED